MNVTQHIQRWTSLLAGVLLVAGCSMTPAHTSWSKPGASMDEFERVSAECEQDQGITGLKGAAGYDVCMQKHGWMLVEDSVR